MIDYDDMLARHQRGLQEVESLEEDEKTVLQHYTTLLADEVMRHGVRLNAPVDLLVINGIKNGIALGLHLSIINGEVQGRA